MAAHATVFIFSLITLPFTAAFCLPLQSIKKPQQTCFEKQLLKPNYNFNEFVLLIAIRIFQKLFKDFRANFDQLLG